MLCGAFVQCALLALAAGLMLGGCGANVRVDVKPGPGFAHAASAAASNASAPLIVYGVAPVSKTSLELGLTEDAGTLPDAAVAACLDSPESTRAAIRAAAEAIDRPKGKMSVPPIGLVATLTGKTDYMGASSEIVEAQELGQALLREARATGANLLAVDRTSTVTKRGSQFSRHKGLVVAHAYRVDCRGPAADTGTPTPP